MKSDTNHYIHIYKLPLPYQFNKNFGIYAIFHLCVYLNEGVFEAATIFYITTLFVLMLTVVLIMQVLTLSGFY